MIRRHIQVVVMLEQVAGTLDLPLVATRCLGVAVAEAVRIGFAHAAG